MRRAVAGDALTHLAAGGAYQRKKAAHATVRIALRCLDLLDDLVAKLVANLPERSHSVLLGATTALEELMEQSPRLTPRMVRLVPLLTRVLGKLIGATFAKDYVIGGVTDPFLQCRLISLCRRLGAAAAMQQARAAGGTVTEAEAAAAGGSDSDSESDGDTGKTKMKMKSKSKRPSPVTDKQLARAIQAMDCLNDILARVATKTDTSRNAGHAVLYEAVQAILRTDTEGGLRVMAVNILGKFLLHRDHNIRYVALQALCRVVDTGERETELHRTAMQCNARSLARHMCPLRIADMDAVRRHRDVIVECLRDADVSLRRRALDLVVALADHDSVGMVAAELVNYLVVAEADERGPLVEKIALVARRFSPSPRWEADCLLMVVAVAGAHARPPVISRVVHLIGALDEEDEDTEEEQEQEGDSEYPVPLVSRGALARRSVAHKVFAMLLEARDSTDVQSPMLAVAAWTVGELGADLLVPPPPLSFGGQTRAAKSTMDTSTGGSADDRADPTVIPRGPLGRRRSPLEVATAVRDLLHHHAAGPVTRGMALVALAKLAARFAEAGVQGFRGSGTGSGAAQSMVAKASKGPLAAPEQADPDAELASEAPRGFPSTGPAAASLLLRGLRSCGRASDSELQARSVELSAMVRQLVDADADLDRARGAGDSTGGRGRAGGHSERKFDDDGGDDGWEGDSELEAVLAPALSGDSALALFERMPVLVEDRHAVAAATALGVGGGLLAGGGAGGLDMGEGEGGGGGGTGGDAGALHDSASHGGDSDGDDDDLLAMGTESAATGASHGGAVLAGGGHAFHGGASAAGGAATGGASYGGDDDDLLAMLGGGGGGGTAAGASHDGDDKAEDDLFGGAG